MGFGWLFMLLPAAVVAFLVLAVFRLLGNRHNGEARPRTPREILDERFAKGEISRDEYEKRRKTLGV